MYRICIYLCLFYSQLGVGIVQYIVQELNSELLAFVVPQHRDGYFSLEPKVLVVVHLARYEAVG